MAEMTLIVDIIIMARTLASIIVIIMADEYDYGWDTFQANIVNMAKMILDIYGTGSDFLNDLAFLCLSGHQHCIHSFD